MSRALSVKNHVLKNGCEYETSPFGSRKDPFTGQSSYHNGEDMISSRYGSDYIIAFQDGVVVSACNSIPGFDKTYSSGNYIYIDHADSYQTRYLHLKKDTLTVKLGQSVRKGDILAYMGTTGYSTGAHIHFEVRWKGIPQDPVPYLMGEKSISSCDGLSQEEMATSENQYQIGDIVDFLGGYHYSNAQASISVGDKRKAGKAKITNIALGAQHPYHLIGQGESNVYGWVDSSAIRKDIVNSEEQPTTFKKGDVVKIKAGAKWYGGGNIPMWVMADTWFVYRDQVGDRVVLNNNTSMKNAIMSPIHAADLVRK